MKKIPKETTVLRFSFFWRLDRARGIEEDICRLLILGVHLSRQDVTSPDLRRRQIYPGMLLRNPFKLPDYGYMVNNMVVGFW